MWTFNKITEASPNYLGEKLKCVVTHHILRVKIDVALPTEKSLSSGPYHENAHQIYVQIL